MDDILAFAIVAIAVLWALARVSKPFVARKPGSAGGCSGCPSTPSSQSGIAKVLALTMALAVIVPVALAEEPVQVTTEEIEVVGIAPDARASLEVLKSDLAEAARLIDFGGFFDLHMAPRQNGRNVAFGDLELGMGRTFSNVELGAAVVLNSEGAVVTNAFADVHLFRRDGDDEAGLHLQAGRFDIPFGRDWQHFASKDRIESSAPLTTEMVMDGGLNATGIHLHGKAPRSNYSVFAFRGDEGERLIGARLGAVPFDLPLELGISLMQDLTEDGRTRSGWFAIDSELEWKSFRVRSEWSRKNDRASSSDGLLVREGWHVMLLREGLAAGAIPVTPYVRFDRGFDAQRGALADLVGSLRTERLTAGMNAQWFRFLLTKVEYQRLLAATLEASADDGFRRDVWSVQAVIVF